MVGKWCKDYVGVACVNGTCPQALKEEWEAIGGIDISKCEFCWLNEGCKDCMLDGTKFCVGKERMG